MLPLVYYGVPAQVEGCCVLVESNSSLTRMTVLILSTSILIQSSYHTHLLKDHPSLRNYYSHKFLQGAFQRGSLMAVKSLTIGANPNKYSRR